MERNISLCKYSAFSIRIYFWPEHLMVGIWHYGNNNRSGSFVTHLEDTKETRKRCKINTGVAERKNNYAQPAAAADLAKA
jgi:hypothetical protein